MVGGRRGRRAQERAALPANTIPYSAIPLRDAGLPILNLINCYSEVADRHSLMVGPKDDHANTLAHRLLADELYKQLHPSGQLIFREAKPEKRVRN